ncbi:MAG: DUF456 domain-containing protein [Pseudomonadota bacterium]
MAAAFDRAKNPVQELSLTFQDAAASANQFGQAASFAISRALSSAAAGQGIGNPAQVAQDLFLGSAVNDGLQQAFSPTSGLGISRLLTGGGPNLQVTGAALDEFLNLGSSTVFGPGAGPFAQAGANFNFASGIASIGAGLVGSLLYGSSTESQIGSTIGGIAGTALGGPVGAILGTLGGGLLGSLFDGPPPPNKEGNTIIDLNGNSVSVGGQEGDKFSQETRDASLAIAQQIDAFADLLTGGTGTSLEGSLRVGVGERDGIYFETGTGLNNTEFGFGNETRRFFDSPEQLVIAAFDDIRNAVSDQLDGTLQQYVQALDVTQDIDVARVTADLQLLQSGGAIFEELADQIGPFEQQFNAVNAVFDEATARLEDLASTGVDTSMVLKGLNDNLDLTQSIIVGNFEEGLRNELLQTFSPSTLELIQLGDRRTAALQEAQAIGASEDLVNRLFDTLYDQIIRVDEAANDLADTTSRLSVFSGFGNRFGNAADRLLTDPTLSPLSPEARLAEAESQFFAAANLAQNGTGDEQLNALEQLETLTDSYLQASRDFYASSEGYYDDFQAAQDILRNTESFAQREINLLEAQLAELQKLNSSTLPSSVAGVAINDNQDFGVNATVNQQLAALSQTFDTPFTQNFGNSNFINYASTLNASQLGQVNSILAAAGQDPLAFNTGGSFTVGGMPGVDTNVIPMALTRGEVVNVSREDNMAALKEEIASLNSRIDRLTAVVAAGATETVGAIRKGSMPEQRMAKDSARQSAAPVKQAS